jgi:hypothetical protein
MEKNKEEREDIITRGIKWIYNFYKKNKVMAIILFILIFLLLFILVSTGIALVASAIFLIVGYLNKKDEQSYEDFQSKFEKFCLTEYEYMDSYSRIIYDIIKTEKITKDSLLPLYNKYKEKNNVTGRTLKYMRRYFTELKNEIIRKVIHNIENESYNPLLVKEEKNIITKVIKNRMDIIKKDIRIADIEKLFKNVKIEKNEEMIKIFKKNKQDEESYNKTREMVNIRSGANDILTDIYRIRILDMIVSDIKYVDKIYDYMKSIRDLK